MQLLMLMLMNLFQARAIDQGLKSMSIRQYVSEYVTDFPELLDLVAADDTAMQLGGVGATQPRTLFPLHLPMNEVMEGLKTRRFLKGTIRCERDSIFDCYVVVHSSDGVTRKSVQIRGSQRVNRAVDGDVVAIELVDGPPTDEEDRLSFISSGGLSGSRKEEGAGVREETAALTADALEGIAHLPAKSSNSKTATNVFSSEFPAGDLFGRVVGVIRRNWRQYAGSLEPAVTTAASVMDVGGDVEGLGGNHSSTAMLFVPVNKRIPRVLISTRRVEELAQSRLLVAIDHWPADSPHPQGHYVRVLGIAGTKEVETAVILHEFDVPHEAFSPEVMACLPPAGGCLFILWLCLVLF